MTSNNDKPLSLQMMKKAFQALDILLPRPVNLLMGGGGAMILAHQFPLATTDIDAIPQGMDIQELDPFIKKIAAQFNWPADWLNPHFSTFSYTLPSDFKKRLVRVFVGKFLTVDALGREEMLIMKCFAHRAKDIGHAKQLIKIGVDLNIVEAQLEQLKKNKIPGVGKALEFLDEILSELE